MIHTAGIIMGVGLMAEDEIKKIVEKRELLRQELEKIDNFLELYRELTGTEDVHSETRPKRRRIRIHPSLRRERSGTVKPADIGPMVRRILLDHGKPMTRSELLAAFRERDVDLAGEDKAKYLGTVLWRMKEAFVNLDGYGYWPRDRAYMAAAYFPDATSKTDQLLNSTDDEEAKNS